MKGKMTLREALKLLETAPDDEQPSAVNPNLTRAHAVQIVRAGIATLDRPFRQPVADDEQISPLAEKRVWQVVKDQLRPRY